MASTQTRLVPKLNDRDVIRAFESVMQKHDNEGLQLRFSDQFGELDADAIKTATKLAGFTLNSAVLFINQRSWAWTRLRNEADPNSSRYDKLAFNWSPQHEPVERGPNVEISADLDRALSRPLATIREAETAGLADHADVLVALESATAKILTDSVEHRQALDAEFLQKERDLHDRIASERERELERIQAEKVRVEGELENRASILDERQKTLDSRQKALDDRNNTHVRREIRASLLMLAKERLANFSVSRETKFQYWAVNIASVLGIGLLAWGSIKYGSLIAPNPATGAYAPTAIVLAVKSAVLAAALVALGSWYLGWLNRWLQRIADAEFRLQQFRLDIERASWLAETVLEWKSTSPEPFPDLLTARLSAGLFQSVASDMDGPKTPASHLADALFGAASSAKLKLGDQEVSFDRRGIKDLRE